MSVNGLLKKTEELLGPFFSIEMVRRQLSPFLILWLTMGVFWPKKAITSYVQSGIPPLTFLVVFVVALIIYSYLNLLYGNREIMQFGGEPWLGYGKINPLIAKTPYDVLYAFFSSLVQNLLLWLPVAPVLLVSAGISGLSIRDSLRAFSILYITSLICGMFGSSVYRLFENRHFTRFIITRLFLAFALVATGFLDTSLNPILLINGMNKGEEMLLASPPNAYKLYMAVSLLVTGLLILEEYIVVRFQKK